MIPRALTQHDILGRVVLATAGKGQIFICIFWLIIFERGDLFGSAYVAALGPNPVHWSEYGSVFLDQVSTPHLIS